VRVSLHLAPQQDVGEGVLAALTAPAETPLWVFGLRYESYLANSLALLLPRGVSSKCVGWLGRVLSKPRPTHVPTHTLTRGTRAYRNIRTRLARQEARARCACVSPGMCSVVSTVDAATRATHLDLLVLGLITRSCTNL
jgi:hypothetical protein